MWRWLLAFALVACSGPTQEASDNLFTSIPTAQLHDANRVKASVNAQTTGTTYTTRETNARFIFTSNTTSITLRGIYDTFTNALIAGTGFNTIGLVIDGVPFSSGATLALPVGATQDVVLTGWGAGSHTFEIVDGPRYLLSGTKRATPAIAYQLTNGASFSVTTPSAPSKRIVVTGDSFSSGMVNTSGTLCSVYTAWPMVMRKNVLASGAGSWAGAHVINDSLAGWAMHDIANDGTSVAALTAQCDGTVANIWVVFLAVNDYLQSVAGATFTNDYGALLDAFHAAVPGATVLACRIPEFNNTTNGAGLTPHGYNLLIDAVVATRGTFASTLDLSATLTIPTDYASDNIHPNTSGQAKLEAAVRTALGY